MSRHYSLTRHVAAAVLQSRDDSDGHGAAWMMDNADRARKRTGADISCLMILLLEGQRVVVTRAAMRAFERALAQFRLSSFP